MNLQTILHAVPWAVGASMSFNALSAELEGAASSDAKSGQTAQAVKPHSHVNEKLGHTPQPAPTKKTDPALGMSKHYHPRDK